MSNETGPIGARGPALAGAALVVAAGLIAGGCLTLPSTTSRYRRPRPATPGR